jgi:hypothetical protein
MKSFHLKAKTDKGFAVMVYAIIAVSALPLLFTPAWYFTLLQLFLILITTSILFRTSYTITDQFLLIRSGFFYRKKLDISAIVSIKPSKSIESAPAPSFDRLEITSKPGRKRVYVSPKNKDLFVALLLERNPEIHCK